MTAPVFMAATTSADGLTVQMLFDQPLQVTPTAPASAFAVMVAAAAATISAVTVTGSQVNLTLSAAITHGQAVTVAYTAPAAAAATTNAAVQNAAGEDAAYVGFVVDGPAQFKHLVSAVYLFLFILIPNRSCLKRLR
jgi:uncharacterized repeat protein (TIGR02059 family)